MKAHMDALGLPYWTIDECMQKIEEASDILIEEDKEFQKNRTEMENNLIKEPIPEEYYGTLAEQIMNKPLDDDNTQWEGGENERM